MNGLSLLSDLRGRLAGLSRRRWLMAVIVGWLVLRADGPGLWPQPPVDPPRIIHARPAPCDEEPAAEEAEAPDEPPPHVHEWTAGGVPHPMWMIEKEYVRCGEVVSVSVMQEVDHDTCTVTLPPCSFPNNDAENGVVVLQCDDGGAGGEFGHLDAQGGFVAGDPITHYRAALDNPGIVQLRAQCDDLPTALDPATGQEIQTFDDDPWWTDGTAWDGSPNGRFTVWEFTISDGAVGFRPVLDAWVGPFTAKIEPATDHNGQSMARPIYFELFSSAEPGYCLNRTREHDPHEWNDTGLGDTDLKFSFPDQQGLTVHSTDFNGWWRNEAWTNEEVTTCAVDIMCLDYGAFGTLTATATVIGYPTAARLLLSDNPRTYSTYQVNGQTLYREYAPIPWDVDANYIADVWMRNSGNAADDEEDEGQCPVKGDGFSRYEEYRGFCVNGPWTELDPDAHKDVFVIDGNDPPLGIGSFAGLGVTPQVFNTPAAAGEFLADCTINFNHGTAHKHLQHGIWVVKWPLPEDGECGRTPKALNAPATFCYIDDDEILGLYGPARHMDARGAVVSHELGHACNLEHCATHQCFMHWPWNVADPLAQLYCEAPCKHAWHLY